MDRCDECGYAYDLDDAEALGQLIRTGVAEMAELMRRGDVDLVGRRDPEVWSPLEYGCHVRDMLLVQRERVLATRRTDGIYTCEPMGRDERVAHDGYAEQEPTAVARQLMDAGQLFAGDLDRLATGDWDRLVRYSYPVPAERSLRWVAAHTLHEVRHHLMDVRRQMPASRSGGG